GYPKRGMGGNLGRGRASVHGQGVHPNLDINVDVSFVNQMTICEMIRKQVCLLLDQSNNRIFWKRNSTLNVFITLNMMTTPIWTTFTFRRHHESGELISDRKSVV